MPDLSQSLHNDLLDDMEDVLIPEGYWDGVVKGGKIKETNADDEPYVDKNGKEFMLAFIYVQCNEPAEGVDEALAEAYINAGGPEETMATYRKFIYTKRDMKKLGEVLVEAGIPSAGKTLFGVFKTLKGSDLPVKVLVEHEEYDGDSQANVAEFLPA